MSNIFNVYTVYLIILAQVSGYKERRPYNFPSEYLYKNGDIMLGGLYQIYEKDTVINSFCSNTSNYHWIELAYSTVFKIEELNRLSIRLYNLSIGYFILPTCDTPSTALIQALNMREIERKLNLKFVVVIGPFTSSEAVAVSPFFQYIRMTHISPTANNNYLFQNSKFKYFFSIANIQKDFVNCLIILLKKFGWNEIAIIYNELDFFYRYKIELTEKLIGSKICIEANIKIPFIHSNSYEFNKWQDDILNLMKRPKPIVVVLLIGRFEFLDILKFIRSQNCSCNLIFIRIDIRDNNFEIIMSDTQNMLISSIFIFDDYIEHGVGFHKWLYNLKANHPWYKRWLSAYLLTLEYENKFNITVQNFNEVHIGLNILTVQILWNNIEKMLNRSCHEYKTHGQMISCLNGLRIQNELLTSSPYLYNVETLKILNASYANPTIAIANFISKKINDFEHYYSKRIGQYLINEQKLVIQKPLIWRRNISYINSTKSPPSRCSEPCSDTEFKITSDKACCWRCMTCKSNEIYQSNILKPCIQCPKYTTPWISPNSNDTHPNQTCLAITRMELKQHNIHVYRFIIVFAIFGIFTLLSFFIHYLKNYNAWVFQMEFKLAYHITYLNLMMGFISVILIVSQLNTAGCKIGQLLFQMSITSLFINNYFKLKFIQFKLNPIKKIKMLYTKNSLVYSCSGYLLVAVIP
ncbi:unnamed protein product [Gordionus sp. m RMFG-2023]